MPRRRLDNRKEIELAEGIAVHLHPAGLAPRLLARLIDYTIFLSVAVVISIPMFFLGGFIGAEVITGIIMLGNFVFFWFYDVIFELMKKPATPGKRIMKLRVVKLSGAPTTFGSSFLRALLLPIDFTPVGIVGICSVMSTRYSQRVGDLAGGTLVVHHIPEQEDSLTPIPADPIRPALSLTREEQVAFVEFGSRYNKLSKERQDEVVACFTGISGQAADARSYALGIASHLSKNEA